MKKDEWLANLIVAAAIYTIFFWGWWNILN